MSSIFHQCVLLLTSNHTHGPTCGHTVVRHGDHLDYLVGDELHHVVGVQGTCCGEQCVGELSAPGAVVSHGRLSELKYRGRDGSAIKRWGQCTECGTGGVCWSCNGGSNGGAAMEGVGERQALAVVAHSSEGGGPGALATTRIYAAGICCPSEVSIVHNVLGKLPGVEQVDVAVVTRTVTVRHAPALVCPATLLAALNEARLEASLTFPRQQVQASWSWMPPPLTLLSLVLLLTSLLHYLSGPTGADWLEHLKWVSLGAVATAGPPILLKAWGALRSQVLDVHCLMAIAVAGAIALGDYTEAGAVVVLFSIADFLEARCSGQARDAIAAVLAIRPETAMLADSGQEVPAGGVQAGTLVLVRPGARVPLDGRIQRGSSSLDESMLTGEAAPVAKQPGSCVSAGTLNVGGGTLHVLTMAAAGDSAVARMAALVERATSEQSPTETLVARFAKYYTPAVVAGCLCLAFIPWAAGVDDHQWWVYLALQLLVTACPCALVISTPVTVVSAVARAARMGVLVKGGARLESLAKVSIFTFDKTGTLTAGSFRIVHLELGTSSPPADPSAPATELPSGYRLCPGITCENQTTVPGTLAAASRGPRAGGSCCGASCGCGVGGAGSGNEPLSEREVLRLVGSLERGTSHPIAAAIVGRAAAQGIVCDAPVESGCQVPGCGVLGEVGGHHLLVGTLEFLASQGVQDRGGSMARAAQEWGQKGVTLCLVAVDGACAGTICAQDALRPEAAEALGALRALGCGSAMLTGDARGVALAVGAAAGVPEGRVHAGLLPGDKLELVAAYQHQHQNQQPAQRQRCLMRCLGRSPGRLHPARCRRRRRAWVGHVGDGLNDAPALAAADVGISMGVAGSAAAVEAGDVALFSNDLLLLPALVQLARRARRVILANIALAMTSKVAVLALASLSMFSLWGAVLVDVGASVLVTLHGVSLLYWRRGQYGPAGQHSAHAHQGHGQKHCHGGGCCAHGGGSGGCTSEAEQAGGGSKEAASGKGACCTAYACMPEGEDSKLGCYRESAAAGGHGCAGGTAAERGGQGCTEEAGGSQEHGSCSGRGCCNKPVGASLCHADSSSGCCGTASVAGLSSV